MRLLMRRSLARLARARARTGNTLRRSERENISDKVWFICMLRLGKDEMLAHLDLWLAAAV